MGKTIIILCLIGILSYFLYINGYMVVSSKRSLMFLGSKRGKKAMFSSCTGYIKRVVKFKENKLYHVDFRLELEKGGVMLELLDARKQVILSLNGSEGAKIEVESGERYYMILRFKSATGSYEVSWD
ncbi:MAG: hypothetical protein IKY94_12890 [Lachnospiraceae bacterium]|nr:hypothetical protein [Lachnospiraceae bacterium]